MKNIDNEEDVEDTRAGIAQDGGRTLKIPKGKTPVYFLQTEFSDGYVHWVDLLGSPTRVVCGGGFEGKGWAVDDCAICKKVATLYKEAKKLKQTDADAGEKISKKAGRMRAKYEAHFLAAAGEMVKEKRGDKKVFVPDFEGAKVGILSLTRQMYEDYTSLRDKEEFPFMHGAKDLTNRIIVLSKSTKEGSTYATTDFIPAKSPSDPPEVEYEADDFDLDEDFVIDEEQIEKVASALDDDDDDEEEDFDEEEEDGEEEELKSKKGKKGAKGKKSGDSAEADFLDDLESDDTEEDGDEEEETDEADEEEEEEPVRKPKASSKKPTASKATKGKATTSGKSAKKATRR